SGKVTSTKIDRGGLDVYRLTIPADGERGTYKVEAKATGCYFWLAADVPLLSSPPPVLVEGKFGKGLKLADGAKLDLPVEGHLNLDEGTIELWFQPDWDAPSGRTEAVPYHYHQLFDSRDGEYDYGFVLYLYDGGKVGDGKGLIAAWADKDKSDNVSVPVQWKKGEWHHLAFAWKKPSQLRLYIDGKLVASKDDGKDFPSKLSATIRLGMNSTESPNTPANGVLDELRISRIMRPPDLSAPLKADSDTLLLKHFDAQDELPVARQ
ncbi:MAG: LamG domain-containing protein, partial [Planctomycetes bacterium]|nr:LamG domain-containing protein [Planctomycetota bacterium]